MNNRNLLIGSIIVLIIGVYVLIDGIDSVSFNSRRFDALGGYLTTRGYDKLSKEKTMAYVELGSGVLICIVGIVFALRYKRRFQLDKANGIGISFRTKKCPNCAEEVKYEAKICRYCKHDFSK